MMSAFDQDGENGDIGRVNAWYSCGLSKVFRLVELQLFTAFKPNGSALVVVEPLRYSDFLVDFRPFRRFSFLFNVGLIMSHNIYFLSNELVIAKFRLSVEKFIVAD